ncbi:MAG: DUF4956 domain-containing protein [Candidatus Omnitrophica bacterium]|nr:DUF4956 domain-containing protein [Candidatus Omnitrophota bacterium]
MLDNLLTASQGEYSVFTVLFVLTLALVLGLIISSVYMRTHSGFSYSRSFVFTLVFVTSLIAVVMMVIGSNLAVAFGLVGALSIIRFRTVVKDTKDTAYIFFALAVGMAVGTQNYQVAIVSTVFISLMMVIFTKLNYGSLLADNYILRLFMSAGSHSEEVLKEIFNKKLKKSVLLNMSRNGSGDDFELVYSVTPKKNVKISEVVDSLSRQDGFNKVAAVSTEEDIEY